MTETNPYAAKTFVVVVETDEQPVVEAFVVETGTTETVEEPAAEAPVEAVEAVPEGSIADVLKWVGEDAQKAAQALKAEEDGANRKTLVKSLKELI